MINEKKVALRAELRALRAALLEGEREARSQNVCNVLLPLLDSAKTLLLFYPKGAEIDLRPLFHAAKARGIPCAFPRCGEGKGEMDFYIVDDLDALEEGKFGIREPKQDATPVINLTGAVIVVPALAFDLEGHRIGYGGGYYDRYLQERDLFSVGVIYEQFLTDSLPHAAFDVPVRAIATEKRIIQI